MMPRTRKNTRVPRQNSNQEANLNRGVLLWERAVTPDFAGMLGRFHACFGFVQATCSPWWSQAIRFLRLLSAFSVGFSVFHPPIGIVTFRSGHLKTDRQRYFNALSVWLQPGLGVARETHAHRAPHVDRPSALQTKHESHSKLIQGSLGIVFC